MRAFVAGASGAIGTRLVPQLIDRGHEVIGTVRSPGNAEQVRTLGAEPITLDLLDAAAVRRAVLKTEPEAIVHQATALADVRFTRNFDRSFAQTNRLRAEGTKRAAGRRAGDGRARVRRRVSPASSATPARAGWSKTEEDPLDPSRRKLPGGMVIKCCGRRVLIDHAATLISASSGRSTSTSRSAAQNPSAPSPTASTGPACPAAGIPQQAGPRLVDSRCPPASALIRILAGYRSRMRTLLPARPGPGR
jgi:hypothetical protein